MFSLYEMCKFTSFVSGAWQKVKVGFQPHNLNHLELEQRTQKLIKQGNPYFFISLMKCYTLSCFCHYGSVQTKSGTAASTQVFPFI